MLNTLPCCANQVSVHPPLSQMRMGATACTTRTGAFASRTPRSCPGRGARCAAPGTSGKSRNVNQLRPGDGDVRSEDHLRHAVLADVRGATIAHRLGLG